MLSENTIFSVLMNRKEKKDKKLFLKIIIKHTLNLNESNIT